MSTRQPTIKQEKFVEALVANGGNGTKAAIAAGYSEKTAAEMAYENLRKPHIAERIRARIFDSDVTDKEVVGTLASHMRGDFADIFPEDEIIKRAQENGVSHLIKKLKRKERFIPVEDGEPIHEVDTEIELYDAQGAAKHLSTVIGLVKQPETHPADVLREQQQQCREMIERFLTAHPEYTTEQLRAVPALAPAFQIIDGK